MMDGSICIDVHIRLSCLFLKPCNPRWNIGVRKQSACKIRFRNASISWQGVTKDYKMKEGLKSLQNGSKWKVQWLSLKGLLAFGKTGLKANIFFLTKLFTKNIPFWIFFGNNKARPHPWLISEVNLRKTRWTMVNCILSAVENAQNKKRLRVFSFCSAVNRAYHF